MTLKSGTESIYTFFLNNYSRAETVVIDGDSGDGYSSFLRVSVRPNLSRQHTLGRVGHRKFERMGIVSVQCFGETPNIAYDIADEVVSVFEGAEISGTTIYFKNVVTDVVGEDDPYFQINISVEYENTDTK